MKKFFNFIVLFILFAVLTSFAQKKKVNSPNSPTGTPIQSFLNLNKISTTFWNDGVSDYDNGARFKYPKETGKKAFYTTGFLWGTKIQGDLRVGGSSLYSGIQPGNIISPGNPESPDSPYVRIYRVRPDVYPGGPSVDLSAEALDEGKTEQEVRDQYELDWVEWRAIDGAPFQDVDNNGEYDPDVDIPGIKDAVQTIWYVANDLDPNLTTNLYGTLPIGIEIQVTVWEYNNSPAFDKLFFKKIKMINKSETNFDDMYIHVWGDPDVGNYSDDFAGCDSLLGLGYAYNSSDTDAVYDPLPPPAVGYDLIRGPLIPGILGQDKNHNGIDDSKDYGMFEGKRVGPGFINLSMTAFNYIVAGDPFFGDPPTGTIQGAIEYYNIMQGKIGVTGDDIISPIDTLPTTFPLSGNPVTGSGWIDGMLQGPNDRRIGLSSGPFQMVPGDTQVVVIAQIAAGAVNGLSRLMAIDTLKHYSQLAQEFYDDTFPVLVEDNKGTQQPEEFMLYQNYPNPFNPSTKIKFTIPPFAKGVSERSEDGGLTTLKVYDILGNEVATLVNEEKAPGTYEVQFDAQNLASGIYLYRIQAGSFVKTKKLILLK